MFWQTHNIEKASQNLQVVSTEEDDGVFVMKYQSLGFGFECRPLGGADDSVQSRINNFLNNDWPVGTIIQYCLFSTDNIFKETNVEAALAASIFHYETHSVDRVKEIIKESGIPVRI